MLIAIDLAAKGLLVLAVALGAVALLRRRSAATRYLVWGMAMTCLLLLPLLGGLVPVWHAPILPELPSTWVHAERSEPATGSLPLLPEAAATSLTPSTTVRPSPSPFPGIMASPTPRAPMVVPYSESPGAVAYTEAPQSEAPRSTMPAWVAVPTWPVLLAGLYFLGAALMLVHLAAGVAHVVRMIRNARPVIDGPLRREFEQAVVKLGIERPVRLLESDDAMVPVAWELFRPAVLLPRGAAAWPRGRRQVVLLHELAHVQRRDCQMQLVAHVALAVHWLNPLAWLAMRRLRIERERACDDRVLSFGCRASDYADHLLQIARRLTLPSEPAWAALAMARTSHLEERVVAILDPENPRRLPDRRTTMTAFATTLVLLLPLAAVQPGAPAPQHAGLPVAQHSSVRHVVTEHAMAAVRHVAETLHAITEHLVAHQTETVGRHEPLPENPPHGLAMGLPRHGPSGPQDGVEPAIQDLVQMRIHGVSTEFIREVREAFGRPVTVQELVQMRIHGASTEFVRTMIGLLPDQDISVHDITQMRIHGVSIDLVRELQGDGYDDLTVNDLVQMKIHGFDRWLRRRGGNR